MDESSVNICEYSQMSKKFRIFEKLDIRIFTKKTEIWNKSQIVENMVLFDPLSALLTVCKIIRFHELIMTPRISIKAKSKETQWHMLCLQNSTII